jgi:hypothetical protein
MNIQSPNNKYGLWKGKNLFFMAIFRAFAVVLEETFQMNVFIGDFIPFSPLLFHSINVKKFICLHLEMFSAFLLPSVFFFVA